MKQPYNRSIHNRFKFIFQEEIDFPLTFLPSEWLSYTRSFLAFLLIVSFFIPYSSKSRTMPNGFSETASKPPPSPRETSSVESQTASTDGVDVFMSEQAEIQRRRRRQLRESCSRLDIEKNENKSITDNMIVDEKYKLMFCYVPKIACTSWKRVFLVLNGVMNHPDDLPQAVVNKVIGPRRLKHLKDLPSARRADVLKDYTKFLVVRHPFERVLSAFRNKMSPTSTSPSARWFQNKIGNFIIDKYRMKPNLNDSRVNTTTRDSIFTLQNNSTAKYDLKFEEFVNFLINEKLRVDFANNLHWREIHRMCSPCQIGYDIVSHFESLEVDAEYILRLVHADHVVQFPSSNGSSPTNSSSSSVYEAAFRGIDRDDLQKLYQRYQLDFELFGYDKPHFLFHSQSWNLT